MLGVLCMDLDECINKYLDLAPKVFPRDFLSSSGLVKIVKGVRGKARFNATSLESAVKEMVTEKLDLGPDAPLESWERAEKSEECRT